MIKTYGAYAALIGLRASAKKIHNLTCPLARLLRCIRQHISTKIRRNPAGLLTPLDTLQIDFEYFDHILLGHLPGIVADELAGAQSSFGDPLKMHGIGAIIP
jgi:hypothetical protein